MAEAQRVRLADLGPESFHQRSLADARLAGHEHELSLAGKYRRQPRTQTRQLMLSTYKHRHRRRQRRKRRVDLANDGPHLNDNRCKTRHRTDEAKAATMHGLDVAERVR